MDHRVLVHEDPEGGYVADCDDCSWSTYGPSEHRVNDAADAHEFEWRQKQADAITRAR